MTGWSVLAVPGRTPPQSPTHVADVHVALTVEADPALPRSLGVMVHPPGPSMDMRYVRLPGDDRPFPDDHQRRPSTALLSAGERSCQTAGMLTLAAGRDGSLLEPVEVGVGTFTVVRW
ncbi:hypothetical protein [Streptosporangium sp. KLBMP 9127]|nr:hypothetical protein [Streptosporangium sp. KLBMP 9127]